MKAFVTDVKQPEAFVPKKVELVFETQEEWETFGAWMKHTVHLTHYSSNMCARKEGQQAQKIREALQF